MWQKKGESVLGPSQAPVMWGLVKRECYSLRFFLASQSSLISITVIASQKIGTILKDGQNPKLEFTSDSKSFAF